MRADNMPDTAQGKELEALALRRQSKEYADAARELEDAARAQRSRCSCGHGQYCGPGCGGHTE